MIALILLCEQLLNLSHGKLGKVIKKVMENHGIFKLQRVRTLYWPQKVRAGSP